MKPATELDPITKLNRELLEALDKLIIETQYIREDKFKLRSNYVNFIDRWNEAYSVVAKARAHLAMRDATAVPPLVAALQEALTEIEHCHADMLTEEARRHPRGSGWARVYDKAKAAIAAANAALSTAQADGR